jgi:hypothetical protein
MDALDARSLGGLNIDQLLVELNFLPLNDFRPETKIGEYKVDCFSSRATAWLNVPVSSSCDIAGSH